MRWKIRNTKTDMEKYFITLLTFIECLFIINIYDKTMNEIVFSMSNKPSGMFIEYERESVLYSIKNENIKKYLLFLILIFCLVINCLYKVRTERVIIQNPFIGIDHGNEIAVAIKNRLITLSIFSILIFIY